jgi:ribosome-associated protein
MRSGRPPPKDAGRLLSFPGRPNAGCSPGTALSIAVHGMNMWKMLQPGPESRKGNTASLPGKALEQIMTETPRRYAAMSAADKAARLAGWLEEHHARDIVVLDISGKSSCMDVVIIAVAGSIRQAQGLADGILALCGEERLEFFRVEGYSAGQWVLLDLNDVVIHIFQPAVRNVYNLEALWNDAAVLRDTRGGPEGTGAAKPGE